MELRWLVEYSEEWHEHSEFAKKVSSEPRLQYRERSNPLEAGIQDPIWSDWIDVPTVRVNI